MNVEDIPDRLQQGFDSLRLGLADLRTQLLAGRVLLELDDGGLQGTVIGRRTTTPIEVQLPQGTCRQGQPREIEALGDLIGDLFLELGLAGARVGACLPLQASCWKVVRWPRGVMPQNGRSELRLRAPDLGMPWPLSEVYLEVQPLPGAPDRSLVLASPRKLVDGWVEVFELAGVQLQRLLPAQACEWSVLAGLEPQPAGGEELWLLQIEANRSRLWLVVDGIPQADWTLPGHRSLEGLEAPLAEQLQRCRQFWRQHRGAEAPQRWLLYGDGERLDAAEPELRECLPTAALQRWPVPSMDANLDQRLSGLKLCIGW
jgi:hypothetical protein